MKGKTAKPAKVSQKGSAGPSGSYQGASAKAYLPKKPADVKRSHKVQKG